MKGATKYINSLLRFLNKTVNFLLKLNIINFYQFLSNSITIVSLQMLNCLWFSNITENSAPVTNLSFLAAN